jgi:phenylpropionate dioxygenase-like ring-hydroxylating dioxygenase large terminal subunit
MFSRRRLEFLQQVLSVPPHLNLMNQLWNACTQINEQIRRFYLIADGIKQLLIVFKISCTHQAHRMQIGREDVGILEKQQKALASALYRPGPLSGRDDMVQALGVWVLDQLGLLTQA